MSGPRALPGVALLELFPFHLWLDEELRVMQAGAVIQRLLPALTGGVLVFETLALLRPALARVDAAALRGAAGQLLVLGHGDAGLRLRGQLLALADGTLLLVLTPWITAAEELERWGLSLADFPIHTAMAEQLESQHRIATHLHQMPLAIIDWDTQGRVAAWNPAAAKIFGVPATEAIGRGVEVLRMIGPVEEASEGFELLGALARRVVVEHERPDGSVVLCAWHNTPLVDLAGAPIGVSSILRDVTESVRAERALLENQKLESLGVLAGGVAHDFNNLLAALLGNVDLAQLQLGLDSPVKDQLEEIASLAERATGLTRQLLDYSGRASYEMKPVALDRLLEQMQALLAVSLSPKIRLTVVAGKQGELPPIHADAGQLRQVIMDLVINGSEAIGERSGELRISTRVVELGEGLGRASVRGGSLAPGSYVLLEVCDDGVGIEPELLPRIFDPFFSTKFTGRGLGLAAILGIVRAHRGALRVTSELDYGTCFEIYFPVEPGQLALSTK